MSPPTSPDPVGTAAPAVGQRERPARAGPPTIHPGQQLSLAQARRVALAAQGFGGGAHRGPVRAQHLLALARRLGAIQIDSVNVICRSHYLPFYSRLGPYDPALLDGLQAAARSGGDGLVEYWAHEASLIPAQLWPWFRFRMHRADDEAWGGMRAVAREQPELVQEVLRLIQDHGPLTAREVEASLPAVGARPGGQWGWNWSLLKCALEHLFWAGRVTSTGRTAAFERRYAAVASVLGEVPECDPAWAIERLVEVAARAHGVASEACLRDYFRLRPHQVRPAIEALLTAGVLIPISVNGWPSARYAHAEAVLPSRVTASALVSPFDSLIWSRPRVRALFDFDYRLEIYTPAAKRVYGYYVLPYLLGERLVARVDLRADRRRGELEVKAVHWEHHPSGPARARLEAELERLATFLRLGSVRQTGVILTARPGGAVTGRVAARGASE